MYGNKRCGPTSTRRAGRITPAYQTQLLQDGLFHAVFLEVDSGAIDNLIYDGVINCAHRIVRHGGGRCVAYSSPVLRFLGRLLSVTTLWVVQYGVVKCSKAEELERFRAKSFVRHLNSEAGVSC